MDNGTRKAIYLKTGNISKWDDSKLTPKQLRRLKHKRFKPENLKQIQALRELEEIISSAHAR